MPNYTFDFYFPNLDPDRQNVRIETWGGHIGTALTRAWHKLKNQPKYKGLKGLCPTSIGVGRPPKEGS